MSGRLIPTGLCWCGCGGEAGLGKFFVLGHDRKAVSAVIERHYEGSIARFLVAHRFGPGAEGTTPFKPLHAGDAGWHRGSKARTEEALEADLVRLGRERRGHDAAWYEAGERACFEVNFGKDKRRRREREYLARKV